MTSRDKGVYAMAGSPYFQLCLEHSVSQVQHSNDPGHSLLSLNFKKRPFSNFGYFILLAMVNFSGRTYACQME